ncbi:GNAT family N-acetyltransferase [Candidatus Albibeggiatoa sp. nov. NOAA]|uniref:GNAT family N-acetyltransferase n=1 Tax=Candidatus Albibeggiatoa sp. nov. NOAA TaxID=3162724 RepID=UPI003303E1C2|nr:GNAT family N-acetyltransferase [Thiotrichaceae bacterium]
MIDNISYELTKDPKLIQKYYEIVKICYWEELGINIISNESEYEKYNTQSHFLIIKTTDTVIGGTRLVVNNGHLESRLPLEESDFLLRNLIKEYPLYRESYGELCRLAILPSFRNAGVFPKLLYHLVTLSKSFSCNYLFSIAPVSQAILYKQTGKKIGVNIQIRTGINVPEKKVYKSIKERILLLSCDLRNCSPSNIF